ncbi:DUF4296 domain-containing protein [Flavobacterium sp. F372]|jgi:hypothetical protein|uniref:DUF4296 domain-containing protein n=1 Tax=Flavobacterium bernardetii TaxID=2813823 RepID=A0ABR7IZN1_9FLAO|nr:DUF4296 domain-containing protein [Flavobacterium bernardetii]MBC5835107.1 DUF4296 domain-containing protein [Flavobacterium bernardetii]NHF70777.1 DUF4296 domain-containing protein [Flavobacterium bernardetii]
MKKVIYLCVVLTIFACSENPVKKPKVLLDEETMENILFDVAVLQATKANSPEVLQTNNIDSKDFIYKKYKIDSATYHQNNRYYAGDVRKHKHMHKRILARLEELTPNKTADLNDLK